MNAIHSIHGHAPLPRCAAFVLFLLAQAAMPALVHAQEKFDPVAAKPLIGRWGYAAPMDKETGEVETTVVEFLPDGRYLTSVRSNLFPGQAKQVLAKGRYRVGDVDKAGITLVLARDAGDPEDKSETTTKVRLERIDDDTLRADDGSVATRIK